MAEKRVSIADAKRMSATKSALIIRATNKDQALFEGRWQNIDDIALGQSVDEVNHFGRHHTAIDDVLVIQDVYENPVARVRVLEMRLTNGLKLTDEEVHALGFEDREDFFGGWGQLVSGRAWFVKFEHDF